MVACPACKILEKDVEVLEREKAEVTQNLQNLVAISDLAILSMKEQLDEKLRKGEELKTLTKEQTKKIAELNDQLLRNTQSKKAEEILASQVAELKEQIQTMKKEQQKEISQLHESIRTMQREHNQELESSKSELKLIQSRYEELGEEHRKSELKAREKLLKAESTRQRLKEQLAASKHNSSELDERLREAKSKVAEFQAKTNSLEANVRKLREELESEKKYPADLASEINCSKKSGKTFVKEPTSNSAKSPLSRSNSGRWSSRPTMKRQRSFDNLEMDDPMYNSPPLKKPTTPGMRKPTREKMTVPFTARRPGSTYLNSPPEGSSPPPGKRELVVCILTGFKDGTRYPLKLRTELEAQIRKLGGKISRSLSRHVNHIIGPPDSRTPKYLAGCLTGRWMMRPEWVTACSQAERWRSEKKWGKRFPDHPLKNAHILVAPPEAFREKNKQLQRTQHLNVLPTLFERLCKGKITKGVKEDHPGLCFDVFLGPGGCTWDDLVSSISEGVTYS